MSVESTIRARVEAFAIELVELVRSSAVNVVAEAFGEKTPSRGKRGSVSRRTSARGKGEKRDPKVLAALTEKLSAFIRKNTGLRIEQIGKTLGVATKDLALPVKKLLASKQISTKGQKRATTYHAGGGGRGQKKAKAPRKVRAKKGPGRARPTKSSAKSSKKATPSGAKRSKKVAVKSVVAKAETHDPVAAASGA